jgi:hypothetical protein
MARGDARKKAGLNKTKSKKSERVGDPKARAKAKAVNAAHAAAQGHNH